jgi:hypothetical protein
MIQASFGFPVTVPARALSSQDSTANSDTMARFLVFIISFVVIGDRPQ